MHQQLLQEDDWAEKYLLISPFCALFFLINNEDKSDHRILSASKLSADKYQHMIALAQTHMVTFHCEPAQQ